MGIITWLLLRMVLINNDIWILFYEYICRIVTKYRMLHLKHSSITTRFPTQYFIIFLKIIMDDGIIFEPLTYFF